MIIDFNRYNGGGGSGSGVTPEQVQQQIDSALTPYWDSAITESAITEAVSGLATEQYVQDALSGVSLEGFWNSAQTQDAISAATSGKADAGNVAANTNLYFPAWNAQGIITGKADNSLVHPGYLGINGVGFTVYSRNSNLGNVHAPKTAGNAGDILVSVGSGAPVWSAVTMPDMSEYTPTSGFSTINGSAITNGGNIVIQGGSGDTQELQDQIDTLDEVVSAALVNLNNTKVESQDIRHMVKLTQSEYDNLSVKDPETFYIIVNNN